jgi:hypothetical protein
MANKSIVGREISRFPGNLSLPCTCKKTPDEDALCRVSNWRHPTKKGAVMLPSAIRVTRHMEVFFAECLVVALGKEPLRRVFFFTECIFPIVSGSYYLQGVNTRQIILFCVLVFGTQRRASLRCTREKTPDEE